MTKFKEYKDEAGNVVIAGKTTKEVSVDVVGAGPSTVVKGHYLVQTDVPGRYDLVTDNETFEATYKPSHKKAVAEDVSPALTPPSTGDAALADTTITEENPQVVTRSLQPVVGAPTPGQNDAPGVNPVGQTDNANEVSASLSNEGNAPTNTADPKTAGTGTSKNASTVSPGNVAKTSRSNG